MGALLNKYSSHVLSTDTVTDTVVTDKSIMVSFKGVILWCNNNTSFRFPLWIMTFISLLVCLVLPTSPIVPPILIHYNCAFIPPIPTVFNNPP